MKASLLAAGLYVVSDLVATAGDVVIGAATAAAAAVAALVAAFSLGVDEGSTEVIECLGARALASWGDEV